MILKEFGQLVAVHANEVRNLVVNKLILETESPDGRLRIKALELLGRMTDIGLFTDKKEITVTHQNTSQLRERLKEKLQSMRQNADGVYEAVNEVEAGEEAVNEVEAGEEEAGARNPQ
jgi:hypothetical protein